MTTTEMTQELWNELVRAGDRNPLGLWDWFTTDDVNSRILHPPSKELWETLVERYKAEWGEDPEIRPERRDEAWIPFDCRWIERMNELKFFSGLAFKNGNKEKYDLIRSQVSKVYKYGSENGLLTFR